MDHQIEHQVSVEISEDGKWVTINGDYEIELLRIRTERDLLAWVLHLTEKSWMTAGAIHAFVSGVGKLKNFSLFGL